MKKRPRTSPARLRIAVTGFGPFPGMPFNASARLVRDLEAMAWRAHKPALFTRLLPTDWREALTELRAFTDATRPDVLVHFGVSAQARGFVVETCAFNETAPRPDCVGALPSERCVRRNAGPMLRVGLRASRLVQRLRMEGIEATLSADAGRYLCNAVLFESLAMAQAGEHGAIAGFIHIPALPEPEAQASQEGFGWAQLRRGAALILETLARSALGREGAMRSA
jgi:pyroglutamyl-peptidase